MYAFSVTMKRSCYKYWYSTYKYILYILVHYMIIVAKSSYDIPSVSKKCS